MADERRVTLDLGVADVHQPGTGTVVKPKDLADSEGDESPEGGAGELQAASIAVVHDAVGRVLTVSRPEPPHEMALPGGHVEVGESDLDACLRELREETDVHAVAAAHLFDMPSPIDGRTVHVFRVSEWSGQPRAVEPGTRIAWLSLGELATQSVLYGKTAGALMANLPTGSSQLELSISAAKRKSLPKGDFALPAQRKYPLDTAARVRNAAARLEQMKKRGKVSDSDYKVARARIASAAKKFGIDSQYNESDKPGPSKTRAGHGKRSIHVRADLAPGGALHVRQLSDGSTQVRFPPVLLTQDV